MTLKSGAIFKEKLTSSLKNDKMNLVNFHASSQKSEKLHFDGFFLSTAVKVSAIQSKEDLSLMIQKFEEKLTFSLKSDMTNFVNFHTSS